MGYPPIKVVSPGVIDLTPSELSTGLFRLRNWTLNMRGRQGDPIKLWRRDMLLAIKSHLDKVFIDVLNTETSDEYDKPVSLEVARFAADETARLLLKIKNQR